MSKELFSNIDLSIIIISWNVVSLLENCLRSIQNSDVAIVGPDGDVVHGNGLRTEVIVVDSASADSSVNMIQTQFPWVRLYAHDENIGFVRGNNLGLQHATGRHIMLLNPDTEVFADSLTRLVEVLESDDRIGVVGPHTLNGDGTHQSSRRRFPTVFTGIVESTLLEPLFAKHMRYFRVMDMPDDGVFEVDWVQGSAMLGRAAVWQEIGGLDERYIMFSEELDWCKRAKLADWQVHYVGDAKITHYGGQSTAQVKARSHVHFQHSKLRYFRKYHGILAALVIWLVLVLHYCWQLMLESAKWIVGHKRSLRAERIGVYWTVMRSLVGGGEKVVT